MSVRFVLGSSAGNMGVLATELAAGLVAIQVLTHALTRSDFGVMLLIANGGAAINLYEEGSASASILVQCRPWNAYRVGIKPVRELRRAMMSANVGEGVLVTSGKFTLEARDFADAQRISLIDGDELLGKISALVPEQALALLKLATQGDFLTPTCPSCGIKMIPRKSTAHGRTNVTFSLGGTNAMALLPLNSNPTRRELRQFAALWLPLFCVIVAAVNAASNMRSAFAGASLRRSSSPPASVVKPSAAPGLTPKPKTWLIVSAVNGRDQRRAFRTPLSRPFSVSLPSASRSHHLQSTLPSTGERICEPSASTPATIAFRLRTANSASCARSSASWAAMAEASAGAGSAP